MPVDFLKKKNNQIGMVLVLFSTLTIIMRCSPNGENVHFNYKKIGEGKPTIVIEAALGDVGKSWEEIQLEIAKYSTVITYDRLGLGKSDSAKTVRSIENLSEELNLFLEQEKLEAPFILVGHSLGGFIVRKYQRDHPDKVAGLILIDPTHEYQYERLMEIKSTDERKRVEREVDDFYSQQPLGAQNEFKEYHNNCRTMRNVKFDKDIPITILASFQVTKNATIEERAIKRELMDDWIRNAPQIELISTTNSGHYIQDSEPELVLDAIKSMIRNFNYNDN